LYIKETNSYRIEKKINPKELYIYKVFDYPHLGPKIKFLLHDFSNSGSKSGTNVAYISSKDLESSKNNDKKKKLYLDYTDEKLNDKEQDYEADNFWKKSWGDK